MIIDASEDVSETGLWIEAVEFGGFDDGHRTGEGFAPGV